MKRSSFTATLLAAFLLLQAHGCKQKPAAEEETMPIETYGATTAEEEPAPPPDTKFMAWQYVKDTIEKFEPHEMSWNRDLLDDRQKAALWHLVEASRLMDEIFLRQVSLRNAQIRTDLEKSDDPAAEDLLHLFGIMAGPYNRLEHNKPFINVPNKRKGATFYPGNMTKDEFEEWIAGNPDVEESFRGPFHVIRRTEEKRLVAVPYSREYAEWLEPAAEHLREAAALVDNPSLARYLESRADAFGSNDYFQSDMDWVNVKDHTLDVTIGPYEVYEDELLGYKAAFESYVCLRDPEQSRELEKIKEYLPAMEENLPIPEEHQNKKRGAKSPVAVVDLIYSAGDAKAGVQTLAFNLPNDETVREHPEGGAKKVILRNMMNGKFDAIMTKISPMVTTPEQVEKVTFDQFFGHTLMHEISHSLGPGTIVKDGEETEVSRELKELYPTIEEAKADTLGMYNSIYLVEQGFFDPGIRESVYITFMAGTFRSVRFGANEAHAKANIIIFNYLVEKGAYQDDGGGRFRVDMDEIDGAVRDLAHDLLMLEATGDYEGSRSFIEKYGTMSPTMEALVDAINDADIPVDIEPVFDLEGIEKPEEEATGEDDAASSG